MQPQSLSRAVAVAVWPVLLLVSVPVFTKLRPARIIGLDLSPFTMSVVKWRTFGLAEAGAN